MELHCIAKFIYVYYNNFERLRADGVTEAEPNQSTVPFAGVLAPVLVLVRTSSVVAAALFAVFPLPFVVSVVVLMLVRF